MGHVTRAVLHLEALAARGSAPDEVGEEAAAIAAGWWQGVWRDPAPEKLPLLVQELRRWCAVAAGRYAVEWAQCEAAGLPFQADEARRRAEALDLAHRALRLYE